MKIIPSIIAKTEHELMERYKKVSSVSDTLHYDIMDNTFVANHTLPFYNISHKKHIEVHLMIKDPIHWMHTFAFKCDTIIAHIEVLEDPEQFILLCKRLGKRCGLAINPQTPVDTVLPYLDSLDLVLILTVLPGDYGAPFVPEALTKLALLGVVDKEVDGHVNATTIHQIKNAGATHVVVGSYFQNAQNVEEAFLRLQ